MGSLIRLNDARARIYLGLTAHDSTKLVHLPGHGMGLKGGDVQVLTGTKDDDEDVSVLHPKQIAVISFGVIQPNRYEVFTSVHPELAEKALIGHVPIYAPDASFGVKLLVLAQKKIDFTKLPWLMSLYLVD